jgi:hypothetical protein
MLSLSVAVAVVVALVVVEACHVGIDVLTTRRIVVGSVGDDAVVGVVGVDSTVHVLSDLAKGEGDAVAVELHDRVVKPVCNVENDVGGDDEEEEEEERMIVFVVVVAVVGCFGDGKCYIARMKGVFGFGLCLDYNCCSSYCLLLLRLCNENCRRKTAAVALLVVVVVVADAVDGCKSIAPVADIGDDVE